MLRWCVCRRALGLFVCAAALLATPVLAEDGGTELADASGDTFDQDTGAPFDVPEADILRSSARINAETIILNVLVRRPTEPLSDNAWRGATQIEWDLDTTGDGTPDFAADYYTDSGRITGGVYRFSDDDNQPRLCELRTATFSPEAGYAASFDRACVGALKGVAYVAFFSYDTAPDEEDSSVGEDVTPDSGMSGKAVALSW